MVPLLLGNSLMTTSEFWSAAPKLKKRDRIIILRVLGFGGLGF